MKSYHKRLLTVALGVALLLALSSAFITSAFHVDAAQLDLQPAGDVRSLAFVGRSDGELPSRDAIDADGYDAVLTDGFELALQSDAAALYFNKKTAEIALMDAKTGHIWYSNPQDRDKETMVEGTTRKRLGAQVTVTYYNAKGAYGQMDSYNDSIAYDGMRYEIKDDQLFVRYHLGKTTVTLADVPQQISKSRMDKFTETLSEDDREDLLKNYRLASVTGQEQSYIDKLKAKYPNVVNEDTYYLTKDSARILKKIRGYLDLCGYTWDDLDFDNEQNEVTTEETSRAHFDVALRYELIADGLRVTLPENSLSYDEKIPPYEIRILEYFGAGGVSENGYMFLPDGCGTLVYYNNGKTTETAFSMRVYGDDTVSGAMSNYVVTGKASLPVFGVKNGAAAFLCRMTSGAELCALNARVAGMQNSYNTAYVSCNATAVDRMTLLDTQQIYFEAAPYRGDVTLEYALLPEASADYMGMAACCRQKLMDEGVLTARGESAYPLVLDMICAAPGTRVVAGVTVKSVECLTAYDRLLPIARATGVDAGSVLIRAEGWLQNGLEQKAMNGLYAEGALGGREALYAAAAALRENGYAFLPQVYLATAFAPGGFSASSDCARALSRDIAVRYDYDYLSRYRRYNNRVIYQFNAARVDRSVGALVGDARKLDLSAVAVADVGNALYSDFYIKSPMHRVAMRAAQETALNALGQSLSVAFENPNAYALPYADFIYDLPCADSAFRVTDESVPFYQAVIRGCIGYAAPALNYADDYRTALLNAVEFGAGLQYTLTDRTTALLKETDYSYVNKGHYTDWLDALKRDYADASAVLSRVIGQGMTGHERIAENVYRTTYANGARVYVNYRTEDVVIDGTTVPARGFAATGGDTP